MKGSVILPLVGLIATGIAQTCPPLPNTGVEIGEPVPINPGDIPAGCSAFEVLVGMFQLTNFVVND